MDNRALLLQWKWKETKGGTEDTPRGHNGGIHKGWQALITQITRRGRSRYLPRVVAW